MKIVNENNINSIISAGESSTVEFKTNVKGAIRFLPRIISAFANTEGGVIIFGYDEGCNSINGTSFDEFEIVKNNIALNNLEDICNVYTIQCDGKTLIIVQVEKTKSVVIAGGGAYIRDGHTSISVLTKKDVMNRVISTTEKSKDKSSNEFEERLEQKIGQIYDELLRSQKVHEEELLEQEKAHKKEKKIDNLKNWFFCILSAVIGWGLGKLF